MKESFDITSQTTSDRTNTFVEYVSIFLIIASILSISIETLPGLSEEMIFAFLVAEVVITVLFLIEYVWRIMTAESKFGYITSFYGIIDFVAILPLFLGLIVDLRALRVFRLFALIRMLKLVRHSEALRTFGIALRQSKEQLFVFFTVAAFFLYLAAIGIYYFEHESQPDKFQSVFHCLWWAIATLTTVGYGDVYPVTAGGKMFASLIVFIGIGIVAAPAGIIAAALTNSS